MIRRLAKDALIAPLLKEFDFEAEGDALKKQFQEKHQTELQRLWDCFLDDVAVERAIQEHPKLQIKLGDTPLSGRAKNCLREADIKIVANIALYSLQDLCMIRGMGKTTLKEIEDYMKDVMQE